MNISGLHFQNVGIVGTVKDILEESGLEPGLLEMEVTEIAVQTSNRVLDAFKRLKDLGVSIAIDDFGTGYSCLDSLRHLPVDTLKVDPRFIRNLFSSPEDPAIVAMIIAMGHAMRLNIISEGVETLDQAQYLSALGCSVVQGFYFSKPVPADEIPDLVGKTFLPENDKGSVVALPVARPRPDRHRRTRSTIGS